jgi:RNA polymerase sigma-70 factor (ECF subfamily)
MGQQDLIPHLFRTEYRKIVSVLCARFGFDQLEAAEDLASETFLAAVQTWPTEGIPPNPVAWLYHVAKNKARNHLLREAVLKGKIAPELRKTGEGSAAVHWASGDGEGQPGKIDLSPGNIEDSQLRMMFSVCHPSIPPEAQVGLSLRILCGFGIDEIADAFLTNKETINKRLYRAKEKLREAKLSIAVPEKHELEGRLGAVMTTIYLLFTEGYYRPGQEAGMRRELCWEAMRLCRMLIDNPLTDRPAVSALMALMSFHGSRLDARVDERGELVLYADQDISRWNAELIGQGGYYLHRSASGPVLSKYHLEANIAYWHCVKEDGPEKWENILQMYNHLLQLEYSPVAALNRTYALARVKGNKVALVEAERLNLEGNPFYFALLGELYTGIDDGKAGECYRQAMGLARTEADRAALKKKVEGLGG